MDDKRMGMIGLTNGEKIKYLNQYQLLDREIARLCEEKELWQGRATRITPSYSDMPRVDGESDRIQSPVVKICELEEKINESIDRLVEVKAGIMEAIGSVGDGKLEQLLRYKYINGLTVEEIADRMYYSYRWVYKLHKRAIECMEVHPIPVISLN